MTGQSGFVVLVLDGTERGKSCRQRLRTDGGVGVVLVER